MTDRQNKVFPHQYLGQFGANGGFGKTKNNFRAKFSLLSFSEYRKLLSPSFSEYNLRFLLLAHSDWIFSDDLFSGWTLCTLSIEAIMVTPICFPVFCLTSWLFSAFDFNYFSIFFQSGRKETVLDLAKFVDKGVQVKLTGGRQGEQLYHI